MTCATSSKRYSCSPCESSQMVLYLDAPLQWVTTTEKKKKKKVPPLWTREGVSLLSTAWQPSKVGVGMAQKQQIIAYIKSDDGVTTKATGKKHMCMHVGWRRERRSALGTPPSITGTPWGSRTSTVRTLVSEAWLAWTINMGSGDRIWIRSRQLGYSSLLTGNRVQS